MSRSDEEGFHPHPGDPWHPKWEGEDDEDVDPFAPKPADSEPVEDRPKKRGLFGRNKQRSESEPEPAEPFESEDEDLPEPSGWEAYDDEMVAADLESVVSDEFPAWTDEGGSSVDFESAFTVGGNVGPDATDEQDEVPDDDLGLVLPGLVAEEATEPGGDAPTELLDEIVLPDLPSIPELFGDAEGPVGDPTDPHGEDIATLDDLLPGSGRQDFLPGSGRQDEEAADEQGPLEIPEGDGDLDLTRAAEDAAAALRSRTAEVRRVEALDMVADELGGIEVDGAPEVEEPFEMSSGHQDSLLSAGLDLAEDDAEPTDPEFTPELDETDVDGIEKVAADDVAAALAALSGEPGGFDPDAELPPPLVASMPEEDSLDDADPTEIVSPEDVDAALSAIASEPIAAADPDALDALRSIGEGDDIDEWAAFADGEAESFAASFDGGDAEAIAALAPPPIPEMADASAAEDEEVLEESPAAKRGLFGRRKDRKAAANEAAAAANEAAVDESEFDDGTGFEDTGLLIDESTPVETAIGDAEENWDDWQEPIDAAPVPVGDTPVAEEAWDAADEMVIQSDEDRAADDEMGSEDAVDAFFSASDEPKRGMFGRRKARKAAEASAAAVAAGIGAGEVADDLTDGWQAAEQDSVGEPEVAAREIDDPFADAFEQPLAGTEEPDDVVFAPVPFAEDPVEATPVADDLISVESAGEEEEYIPVPVLDGVDEDDDAWQQEFAADVAPPVPPVEQPMADMPLLDDDDDRIEVTPIAPEPEEIREPGVMSEPQVIPESAGSAVDEEFDAEDLGEEPSEWQGEGSSVPASWFAHVDEDEAVVEDMQPVDVDEEAPLLEAGGMFDVDDILDPVGIPVPTDPIPPQGLSVVEESVSYEEPAADTYEPTEVLESPPVVGEPPSPVRDDGGPDFLGAATALIPGGDEGSPEPRLWDETVEMDAADIPEPPSLPGGDAVAWDAPPLVPGHDWEAEGGAGESFVPPPPIDPTAEVYDVVEDDLDSAPVPRPAAVDPDAPAEWSEDIYSGAVTMEHRGLAEAIAHANTEDRDLQALSAAMPGLDTGVVGFEDVEDLGTDEVYIPPARSDLGARVLTGLILMSLLFGSLWVSGGALAAFIGVMLMIGLTEYFTTLRQKGYTPLVIFGYLGAIGALAGTWAWGPIAIPGAILSTTVVVFFFYAFAPRRRDALVNGGLTVMGMAWVTATIAFAMPIIASEHYRVLVFALVAATVAMDVGAYGFGRAWGSAQMAPVLSPNKSIEGLAGGVVLTIGVSIAIGFLMDPFDIRSGAALGLVVAITAPLGDLAESMFKRSLGVKDMGAILPGHGGIMDRVDAFLFVIPSVWVLYVFLGYLN